MRLYGREREVDRIERLLAAARAGSSAALVLRGEPGVGKTALLHEAIERADGMTVLAARGLEVEAHLAYSGLSDLLTPILGELDTIPAPQSAGLAGALGLAPPVAADRFVVCVATLSLIAAAADQNPVFVALDDVHWLDDASREAILFATRRFEADSVAVAVTMLDTGTGDAEPLGLEELALTGLDSVASNALLTEHSAHAIAANVAEHLVRATQGNPLALTQLAASLNESQLTGAQDLEEPLPLADRLKTAFLRRVERLPEETREALLVVAASYGETNAIEAACRLLELAPAALGPAESADVIRREARHIVFSHPLLRAAVYHAASISARSRAHEALAGALDLVDEPVDAVGRASSSLERRAWQLAAAAPHPNESVAATLEQAAESARGRGGYAGAASALERAARLSPAQPDLARRLLAAGRDWQLAGHPQLALDLLDEALSGTENRRQRAEIQHLRAQIKMGQGEFTAARDLLANEASKIAPSDPARATLMLADGAVAASAAGSVDDGMTFAREARVLGEQAGGTAAVVGDVVLGAALLNHGDPRGGAPLVLRHAALLEGGQPPMILVQVLPDTLMFIEEYEKARLHLDHVIDLARGLAAPSLLVFALPLRAELSYRTGDWLAGHAAASQGLRLAREVAQGVDHALVVTGRIEAARGLERECREHAAEALDIATKLEIGHILSRTHGFLGKLELGLGNIDAAIIELEKSHRFVLGGGVGEPNIVQEGPDLVEAYVRAGRLADAGNTLARLQSQAEKSGRVWGLAAAARCRGLLADTGSFEHEFEEARALHERTPTPFELGRTELCFGERLRRARRPSDARVHLRSALEIFDRLDAAPWARRVRTELAATGETHELQREKGIRELTPQELELALLVGRGATNREASAALFLSPKTIEAHLHRIYVKLGIRSRTELAHHLAREHMLG